MDIISYAISKKFTEDTADSLGSLKGAPCIIKSKVAIDGGTRITFSWTGTSGTEQTETVDIMDGADGNDGLGIKSVAINASNHLIVTYDDDTTEDAGEVQTVQGEDGKSAYEVAVEHGYSGTEEEWLESLKGEPGEEGFSPEITVKESTSERYVLTIKTKDDEFDTPNLKGGGSGSASRMSDLEDVQLTSLTTGQILKWNGSKWVNEDGVEIDSLGDINDVDLTNVQDGQIIAWDNTARKWVNTNRVVNINDLVDVNIGTLSDGQILKYDDTLKKWINGNAINPTQLSVMVDAATMPQAIVEFVGTTTANYTKGYFYYSQPSVVSGEVVYTWTQIAVQPSNDNYENLQNLPQINNVEVIGSKSLDDLGINGKFQYDVLPTPTVAIASKICQYIGSPTADFKTGYWYQCIYDVTTAGYKWSELNVSGNTALANRIATLETNQGDMSALEVAGVSDLVSAINAINNRGLTSIVYTEPNLVITYADGSTYSFNVRDSVLRETQIGELANVNDSTVADGNILQYDSAIIGYKPYDLITRLTNLLQESKDYTDQEIASAVQDDALYVDDKPVCSYDSGEDKYIVVYYQSGVVHTTADTTTRFYYIDANDDPWCTSWFITGDSTVDPVEFSYLLSSVNLDNFVNKTTDVVHTYTEDMLDKTKIPDVAALDALLAIVKTALALKVNIADVIDNLTSSETTKPLSANQGKKLKALVDAKQDIMQYATMLAPSSSLAGRIVQYVGVQSQAYKSGSFYKCIYVTADDEWIWQEIAFAPDMVAITAAQVDAMWA